MALRQRDISARDIIVIGASAGGVQALQTLMRQLPANLKAAIFVVVHISAQGPGLLPDILSSAGPLPAAHPHDGETIEAGHVYVAPPNYHIVLEQSIIRVVRGPRENRHRPAIDPLFRSAALHYGPRVIGVILTGMLDDGTAGLLSVKQYGGVTVVQDPADAVYPDMPLNALRGLGSPDHLVVLSDLPALLVQLISEPPEVLAPEDRQTETELTEIREKFSELDPLPVEIMDEEGAPSPIACPVCHGVLWEVTNSDLLRFRCRVGHAFTAQSLLSEHAESLERALWIALRTLEENASLNRRLAILARDDNSLWSAARFIENAVETEHQAEIIRRVLLNSSAVDMQDEGMSVSEGGR